MRDRRFTIMIMGESGEKVKQLRISQNVVVSCACILGVFASAALASGGIGIRHWVASRSIRSLQQENRTLVRELDRVEANLATFREDMEQQYDETSELRHLANLDPLDHDVWQVGVGGPEIEGPDPLAPIRESQRTRVARVAAGADELLRQARLVEESYQEIEGAFTAQKDRWDHTPSIRPVNTRRITGHFGYRNDPFTGNRRMHSGLDYSLPEGRPVMATADGVVRFAGRKYSFGNLVEIDHGNGLVTRYAHNSQIKVKRGDHVKRGDVIALVGRTGRSTAPHLHYEVLENGTAVDPMKYVLPDGILVD